MLDAVYPIPEEGLTWPTTEPKCRQLADLVAARAGREGMHQTLIPGLELYRIDAPSGCVSTVYEPSLCVIAQGRKVVELEDRQSLDAPHTVMMSSVGLPVRGRVGDAPPEAPYVGVDIGIGPAEVADLLRQLGDEVAAEPTNCPYPACGLCVAQVD